MAKIVEKFGHFCVHLRQKYT